MQTRPEADVKSDLRQASKTHTLTHNPILRALLRTYGLNHLVVALSLLRELGHVDVVFTRTHDVTVDGTSVDGELVPLSPSVQAGQSRISLFRIIPYAEIGARQLQKKSAR